MSVAGGPDIIEDELILYLDAGNRDSYPGTGTAWTDLSRNGYNGTLIANNTAPTFNSARGGSIDFAFGYCTSTINLPSSAMTVEIVFKVNNVQSWTDIAVLDDGTNEIMLERGSTSATPYTDGYLRYYSSYANGVGSATDSLASPSQYIASSNILHTALTVGASVATSFCNGIRQGSASVTENKTFNRLVLANDLLRANRMCFCNIYLVRLYRRALTQLEVLQNYNATKGRFSI